MKLHEITRKNFQTKLSSISEKIKEADFLAFDTELTGLCTGKLNRYSILDEPEERYQKLRESASSFGLIQFGLTSFKWSETKKKFDYESWSFYLIPDSENTNPEKRFSCQLSSLKFLSENNFNFNKVFYDGISFISLEEESFIKEVRESRTPIDIASLSEKDKTFIDDFFECFDKWSSKKLSSSFKSNLLNSYQRRLIYDSMEKRYGNLFSISKSDEGRLSSLNISEATELEELKNLQQKEKSLIEAIGFRKIIDIIIDVKKPLIGHNCLLDLCHIYQKFIGNLPVSWMKFQDLIKHYFPIIFDTKVLASSLLQIPEGSSHKLEDLYNMFESSTLATKMSLKEKSNFEISFHHAGFDSYCSGYVFLGIINQHLSVNYNDIKLFLYSGNINGYSFINRVFMMQSDFSNLNLHGKNNIPDRSAVLYFGYTDIDKNGQEITDEITNDKIYKSIESILKIDAKPRIIWANFSSFFLIFELFDQAKALLNNVEAFKSKLECERLLNNFSLISYVEYSKLLSEYRQKNDEKLSNVVGNKRKWKAF